MNSKDKGRLIRFGPRRVEEAGEPRPGRRPIPMLRARILHSAMELFGEKGFEDVPIDDVAARAGVGKGSVYRQFGSKEQLYAASVIEGFAQLRNQIDTALAQAASIPERITAIVHHTVSYFWTRRQFFILLRDPTKLPREQEVRYRKERGQLSALISEVLREGARSGSIRDDLDFDLMAESLLGMIRGIQRYRAAHVILEDTVHTVVSTFLHGSSARTNSH
ncbi:MAG TPA: TetR/AcrR family transcriptional regulator [Candidatus Binataceae bacterium]